MNAGKYKTGDHIPITIDLNNEPGSVLMSHPRKSVIFESIQAIRDMESSGVLYEV